jgi:hypothetical protein
MAAFQKPAGSGETDARRGAGDDCSGLAHRAIIAFE